MTTQLRLGINTCFAVKRWSDPSQWAEKIARLGITDVQFSIDLLPVGLDRPALRSYVRRMRDAVEEHGLTLHSWFTGLAAYGSNLLLSDAAEDRAAAESWYRTMIDLAADSGARGFGGHVGAFSVPTAADPRGANALLSQQISAMHRLADHALDAGLDHLQFENLAVPREFGHSIPEAHELERRLSGSAVPWRLCLDLGHPVALPPGVSSTDPVDWLTETWLRTPVVQLQQSPRGADHHGPFTEENNAVGAVVRDDCLRALRGWGPAEDVFLFFEIIPAHEADDDAVLRELKESVEYWKKP